jgi:uncharacterized protein
MREIVKRGRVTTPDGSGRIDEMVKVVGKGPHRTWAAVLLATGLTLAPACGNEQHAVQTSHVAYTDLTSAPIPSDWVLEGKPEARVKHLAKATDDGLAVALWDCTAGKFNWFFQGDEFVHILEGEVTISNEDGSDKRVLKPGDVAYFIAGTHSIWQVDKYVKKVALFRDNHVGLVWKARNKLGQLFSAR